MQSVTVIFVFKEFIEHVGDCRFASANYGAGCNPESHRLFRLQIVYAAVLQLDD